MEQQPALEVNDLHFSYPGSDWELRIPALRIAQGEHTYVFGSSGCGKSTLLNLIAGVLRPAQGTLKVAGETLHSGRRSDQRRANTLGFVFQQFNLVGYLDVLTNVVLPCKFSPMRKQRVLEHHSNIDDEGRRLLERLGLDARYHRSKPSQLSVGQQQRVAVARALIGRPPVVLCDEPTSALDPAHRDQFLELLLEECAAAQSTAVVVSHDPALRSAFKTCCDLTPEDRRSTLRVAA